MPEERLTLIVPAEPAQPAPVHTRSGGVQTRGPMLGRFFAKESSVDLPSARKKLETTLAEARDLLVNIETENLEGWKLDEITLGLAVSAEGSIGIATAGVESTIQLKFSRVR